MNGVGNKSDCALLSYNTQQQDNNNQCARILDKCPILMRAGHVIGEVAIVESQGQSVEIWAGGSGGVMKWCGFKMILK